MQNKKENEIWGFSLWIALFTCLKISPRNDLALGHLRPASCLEVKSVSLENPLWASVIGSLSWDLTNYPQGKKMSKQIIRINLLPLRTEGWRWLFPTVAPTSTCVSHPKTSWMATFCLSSLKTGLGKASRSWWHGRRGGLGLVSFHPG